MGRALDRATVRSDGWVCAACGSPYMKGHFRRCADCGSLRWVREERAPAVNRGGTTPAGDAGERSVEDVKESRQ